MGIALAIDRIRRGLDSRFVSLLAAALVVGLIFSSSTRFGLLAAIVAGVALNTLLILVGWWALRCFVAFKAGGHVSDDTLHLMMCWIALTVFVGAMAPSQARAIPILLAPLALGAASLLSILQRQRHGASDLQPKRMVLLRTFGRRALRRKLLRTLEDTWRRVGTVDLVVGADVAPMTINALALEDFLAGRIERQFISSTSDLSTRVPPIVTRRAIDGRFPLNDIHCSSGVWRAVVTRLIVAADVVLMDLRGFQAINRGAAFELALVVREVPLSRLLLLTDRTTDEELVRQIAADAWSREPLAWARASGGGSGLRLLRCSGAGRDSTAIVDYVFAPAFVAHETAASP